MKPHRFRLILLITLLLNAAIPSTGARSASLTVTTLTDIKLVDGHCSLREAIQNANNNLATNVDCPAGSGLDTITFNLSGEITLTAPLPAISDTAGLVLDGTGQSVTVSGDDKFNVTAVGAFVPLTINQLTIAAAYNNANLGAIENYGTLTITHSTFSDNNDGSYNGGAIHNRATLIIHDSIFSRNTARNGYHGGGAVYSLAGSVTITDSFFSDNSASNGGAIYCSNCTLDIIGSTFSGNDSPMGSGGAIYNYASTGTVTVTDSTFSGNLADSGEGGGGIYSEYGALTITHSSFSFNSAADGAGGAVYSASLMDIRLSSFLSNTASTGGGIFSEHEDASIANSTFYDNSSTEAGGSGGALVNTDELVLSNSTVAGSQTPAGGAAIYNSSGMLRLSNTIVSGSSGANCSGAITNGGHNLEDGGSCGWGASGGSISGANPLLGTLSGSPQYLPLQAGSPALETGDDGVCNAAPVDRQSQNGLSRPQGLHCDIGSYERPNPPLFIPLAIRQ